MFYRTFFFFLIFFSLAHPQGVLAQAESGCCEFQVNNTFQCVNYSLEFSLEEAQRLCKENPSGSYFQGRSCNSSSGRCEWCPPGKFCLQVPFPGSDAIEKAVGAREDVLLTYIKVFFQFTVWLSITLAIFMMMVAGFLYLTAGGDAGKVTRAKEYISNSIMGVVLALLSFLILQGINPRLVRLSLPEIPEIPTVGTGGDCCVNKNTGQELRVNLIGKGEGTAANTCEKELSVYYGPGWVSCNESSACVCEADERPIGKTYHAFYCGNFVTMDECDKLTPEYRSDGIQRRCSFYGNTSCETLKNSGKIQPYNPLERWKFEGLTY